MLSFRPTDWSDTSHKAKTMVTNNVTRINQAGRQAGVQAGRHEDMQTQWRKDRLAKKHTVTDKLWRQAQAMNAVDLRDYGLY